MPRRAGSSNKTSADAGSRKGSSVSSVDKDDSRASANKKPRLTVTNLKDAEKENSDIEENIVYKTKAPQCNFYKYYRNHEMGYPCQMYKKPVKDMIINYCRNFQLYKIESPFDRRVTFIVWHPTNPRVLSVTSHGGDVILYNYEEGMNTACIIKGIGAGGSVQGMKFDPLNPVQLYTVSMEGKFLVLNFHTKEAKQFLETNDINRWYVSVDVNSKNNLMVAGDTKGSLTVLTIQGEFIDKVQMHKKGYKVNHVEFSKRESWLLCTSSTDGFIKLWDIRSLKSVSSGLAKPLQMIPHQKPINAAYFSLTDGCRLLTTDQSDRIQIYRAPLWTLETSIHHPHRQFQHLTPIKAYWHPLEDIVFVGRYPHVNFPGYHENELRTIDFFDADTGDLLYQHYQKDVNGILSLNRFNITGDALASSYGYRFMIWKPNLRNLEKLSKKLDRIESKENEALSENDEIDWSKVLKKKIIDKKVKKTKEKEV